MPGAAVAAAKTPGGSNVMGFNPLLERYPQGESPGNRKGIRLPLCLLAPSSGTIANTPPSPTQRQKNTVTADENVSPLYKVSRVLEVPFPITKWIFCYSSRVGIFIFSSAKGAHTGGTLHLDTICDMTWKAHGQDRGASTQLPENSATGDF